MALQIENMLYELHPIIFEQPQRLQAPQAWVSHIPFAFWVVEATRPRVLVELGTHSGNSYFAFCQAVQALKLDTACFAVDTWTGDTHSGLYGEEIFQDVSSYHDHRYASFSRLIRSTFDTAVSHFTDGSIDLLHIDGFHTYDAVKHDFETWLPKLSARGVVLIHDTNVHELDFGVWRFWEQAQSRYATFHFLHGHGLGVIAFGHDIPKKIRDLVDPNLCETSEKRSLFSRLGTPLLERFEHIRWQTESELEVEILQKKLHEQSVILQEQSLRLGTHSKNIADLTLHVDAAHRQISGMQADITQERDAWRVEKDQFTAKEKDFERRHKKDTEHFIKSIAEIGESHNIELEKLHKDISENKNQCISLRQELQLANIQLQRIQASKSWKITSPVRYAAQILRSPQLRLLRKSLKFGYWCFTIQLKKQLQARKIAQQIQTAGLFDAEWYFKKYPEIKFFHVDPLLHFLFHGAAEGNSPHPLFSTKFYLDKNPDVAQSGINPLIHFLSAGAKDGRNPHYLFDVRYYALQNNGLQITQDNPLAHFIRFGANAGLNPHPLFDTQYYCEHNADVASSGINPLIHFILDGWKELRKPNPLFDTRFYFEHYRTLIQEDEDPLSHFIREGVHKGCNPNAFFDCSYYLERYDDIRRAGMNPLEHFLLHGAKELRDPSPRFCSKHYWQRYPDVSISNLDPLAHYLLIGIDEGREPLPGKRIKVPTDRDKWKDFCAAEKRKVPDMPGNSTVSVIIPVYRGYESTRRCIESVLHQRNVKVTIINDCTPDPNIAEYLQTLINIPQVTVIQNMTNLGFVRSVNMGMLAHPDDDVILLNSDTEVSNDWVDRLRAQAYSDAPSGADKIGTVTPFSNNATLCSYPSTRGFTHFPPGESLESFDKSFYEANQGRSVTIPTAVGFCMYIKRDCLNDVGLFDEASFGKGYGEENDFCFRASKHGWKHLLAADVFVYHQGEVSFAQNSSPAKIAASKIIRERYPDYEAIVALHLENDPADAYRVAATAARLRLQKKPVVLFITHALDGGTEKHIQELIHATKNSIKYVILRPASSPEQNGDIEFEFSDETEKLHLVMSKKISLEFLTLLVRSFGTCRIHLHHTLGIPFPIMPFIRSLQVPFDVTIHDYSLICPQVTLTDELGDYCGEPHFSSCTECITKRPSWESFDILWWRLLSNPLFSAAARILCPTFDVVSRMKRYFPDGNYFHVPHLSSSESNNVSRPQLSLEHPLRIVILGTLSPQKGSFIVLECAELITSKHLPVNLHVIGYFIESSQALRAKNLKEVLNVTGRYREGELASLIEMVDPHLIWFPARGPETYSYALSEALKSGRPILAPRLGAFTERLEGREVTWLVNWNISPEQLVLLFEKIRQEMCTIQKTFSIPKASLIKHTVRQEEENFYPQKYLQPITQKNLNGGAPLKKARHKISVLLLVERLQDGVQPSPCSYIRILLPLTRLELQNEFDFTVVTYEEVFFCSADILVVNRIAVANAEKAEQLINYCLTEGIKLVYDLDDDVFALENHPEQSFYESSLKAVTLLMKSAQIVWVSTDELALKVYELNSSCEIMPNFLDENLWLEPSPSVAPRVQDKVIRILYMGTATHALDFQLIKETLVKLSEEFGDTIAIELVGVLPDDDLVPSCATVRSIPHSIGTSYPAFVRWLISGRQYDIGLAPLVDSTFNRSKSEIKFLDYAAMGSAPVCSHLRPYQKIGIHKENCLLVSNEKEKWLDTIRELIVNNELRKKIQQSAKKTLMDKHTLHGNAFIRKESLLRIVEGKLRYQVRK